MASQGRQAGLSIEIAAGVGVVRDRTIEVGARVLWIDNIGSLRVVRGERSFGLLILGAVVGVAGLASLRDNSFQALLLIAVAAALIAVNLNQKVEQGLSIGTTDGRRTLIVSTDEKFLADLLEFIRQKIDTRSATLQGEFDISNNIFRSGGGGVVVGQHGMASGAGGNVASARSSAAAPPQQVLKAPDAPSPRRFEPVAEDPPADAPAVYDQPVPDYEPPPAPRKLPAALILGVALTALALGGGGFLWAENARREREAAAALAAWQDVPREDVAALRDYVADEAAIYRADALAALRQLEQRRASAALQAGTVGALEAFLAEFPESGSAAQVRERLYEVEAAERFMASTPVTLSPASGSIFAHYPRQTTLTWAPLEGAASYIVEVQMFDSGSGWVENPDAVLRASVSEQTYSFNFVGAQPGRWRVRGVDGSGQESIPSQWWEFRYQR